MDIIVTCSSCGEQKEISEFPIRSDTKKIRKQCKVCWKKNALISTEKYNATHKEKIREYASVRYKNNKEFFQKKFKEWRLKNKDKRVISNQKRRAKKISNGGSLSNNEWKEILEVYGNKCLRCGSTERITIDHVIPISLGGRNDKNNVQPLCYTCNCKKNNRIEDYR